VEYTPQTLKEIGDRICLTERFYNCANGFTINDDLLPERFFSEAGSSGEGIEVPAIDRSRFDEELQKYYRIRGLTSQGTFEDSHWLERQP
jgi:aldehyde:ferredoxin oxidoreductase